MIVDHSTASNPQGVVLAAKLSHERDEPRWGRPAKSTARELSWGRCLEGFLHVSPRILCRPFRPFLGREMTLTGGSRTPARVVSAHSRLFSPWKIALKIELEYVGRETQNGDQETGETKCGARPA